MPSIRALWAGLLMLLAPAAGAVPVVGFELQGVMGAANASSTAYVAFIDGASRGLDAFDAFALTPPAPTYVQLFAVLGPEAGAGEGVELAIDALPPGFGAAIDVRLGVRAVAGGLPATAAFTLTWPLLQDLPAGWRLVLHDGLTGTDTDLRLASSYTFAHDPADAAPRFTLHITDETVTGATAAAPPALALDVAPNPARAGATVRFTLPEAAAVRLTVSDALGREVVVLADGPVGAGRHEAALGTGGLRPGVYVLRLDTGGRALVRRVTVGR